MFNKFRLLHYFFSVNARGKTIARCLNFDIVASADDMTEAELRLDALVRFHIESFLKSNGLTGLNNQAPKKFWAEYTESLRHGGALPSSTLRICVPEVVPMEKPYGDLEVLAAKAA